VNQSRPLPVATCTLASGTSLPCAPGWSWTETRPPHEKNSVARAWGWPVRFAARFTAVFALDRTSTSSGCPNTKS